ncbi:hypothetical protein SLEP1_g55240 [Rubroshorea leprosula]|uniref:TSL-kinase interacting protein 1 n=1 Tax=Rubroshorea leprosula TaxID=152421 RepID=A0AAV5MFN4_9ROSI|nr:hypothetical protein SLEP1_g55240 [Rubroshorea leprosula]
MQTESEVSFAPKAQVTDFNQESIPTQSGDPGVVSSTLNNVSSERPAKKPTRQWAAWTRQEEESFFMALRQVGKNFEKITCRVQSKNKDQVRHYYYRLVRRMNKLLGPGLCLDAKNSKDTNAAMLRWWSLLEKYSCRASKLHLKPRRFKIFVEALEHQLLKDRKKNIRKRPSQNENCSPASPNTISNQGRLSGHDARSVKLVFVDSQNIQKLGPGKGSFKRNANIGVSRSNIKGESTTMKPARQRRKSGASSAAYKKWEKAAIAGVSLVADAAEHLERTTYDKDIENDQDKPGQHVLDQVESVQPLLPNLSQNPFVDNNVHAATGKLKLQLFPIDDGTRRALEMDKHNPHLELTLSTRKKISSVLEHLNRKWGNSSVASGELMLFPYSVQRENLIVYQRWTQASAANAADVYAMIGSPSIFRLRYGWFSNAALASLTWQAPFPSSNIPNVHIMNVERRKGHTTSVPCTGDQSEKLVDLMPVKETPSVEPALPSLPNETGKQLGTSPKNNVGNTSVPTTSEPLHRIETVNGDVMRHLEEADDQRLSCSILSSVGEWADSFTNISVGDLLSEVPDDIDANCVDTAVAEGSQCLQLIPFSCDSFDAAIAAHISRHDERVETPILESHALSILDAEETCDAFSFQKNPTCPEVHKFSTVASPGACNQIAQTNSVGSGNLVEGLHDAVEPIENSSHEGPIDEDPFDPHILDNSAKDFNGLTDMYWPDSLGPLDLDMPSSKYHSEDLILSDSLGGLNRLIASSLDAFQNCSFFGFDKKDSTPAVEARESAS